MKNITINKVKNLVLTVSAVSVMFVTANYGSETESMEAVEQDLANSIEFKHAEKGDPPVIQKTEALPLPRLFTVPTAYALKSYELRFGGEGNIHSTLANMNTAGLHASIAIGLGNVVELGYQLGEYHTVGRKPDNIMMGLLKLAILKESQYFPAVSISAGQNLKENFSHDGAVDYRMARNAYDLVMSKSFDIKGTRVSVHPGLEIHDDRIKKIDGEAPSNKEDFQKHKFNYRMGLSWQTKPNTVFMYESKLLDISNVDDLTGVGFTHHNALENNLGVRYYIRNWLCMDAGIRYMYDLDTSEDDMKLHANFVGVVPLNTMYVRLENIFKK
ncbi:MAG: hypothetical protein HQK83_15545 [Fibrobacteria bacterium]|nr:hypothetical protein [Fibrobacteria bacterium]